MTDKVPPTDGTRPARRRYHVPKRRGALRRRFTGLSQKLGRSFGQALFDDEGRPRALVRKLVFDAFRRPRPGLEGVVFKEPGRARRPFARWLAQADEALPPLVAGLPFPSKAGNERRYVVLVRGQGAPDLASLRSRLARDHALIELVLDGSASSPPRTADDGDVHVVLVSLAGSGVPRAVLLDALALEISSFHPLFAVAVGLETADAADLLEQRNVPTVLLADGPQGWDRQALDLALARAGAVVFPSGEAREEALRLLPQHADRQRLFAAEASTDVDAEQVAGIGAEIGHERDNELALILATEPERLEMLDIEREDDPPGGLVVEERLSRLIAGWRCKTLLKRHPNRPPLRRPYAGFHPLIYAEYHPEACFDRRRYPLSHWIEQGRPEGPWTQPLILPPAAPLPPSRLKSAVHGHFFYTDLLPELLERLSCNASRPDLLLTTDSEGKADELRTMTAHWPASVRVVVVPNLGRDVGPFVTGLREELTQGGYDVVFHVHGKKTKGRKREIGDPWRNFLWENLIGGAHPMLDAVLDHMARHPHLGLVYPEDTHLLDWARNGRIAGELRQDMGLVEPVGVYVDFPVGNMFAVRPQALAPVFGLELAWEDYPAEPVPDDGTLMHGLERVLPMVVRHAGFSVAGVRVPGTDWD